MEGKASAGSLWQGLANATERTRLAEDDYFRRRDAELIEQARQTREQATVDSLAAIDIRALADALGVHDDRLVGTLYAAGFRARNSALLDWLPVIDVAWADGLDVRERHELRLPITADPRAEKDGVAVVTDLLFIQQAPDLMEAAREVLRHQLAAMDPVSRRSRLDTIIERCKAVAEASGGVWIVGAVSSEERRRIAVVRAGLAGTDAETVTNPSEFPH